MKRSAEVEQGVLDTSLQRLTWNNIRDVFVILKKQGLLGPLSTAALKAAYAKLLRDFQRGGSEAFRQSWTRDEWFAYFWQTLGHQMADENAHFEEEADDYDHQKLMTTYEYNLHNEWNAFPDNANFFHVFIAYLVRSLQLESVTLERDGYYMRIYYHDNIIDHYAMYNGNPDIAENRTDYQRNISGVNWILNWNREDWDSSEIVPFVYRALQDGWRFRDAHDIMERAPREILAQIGTQQPMQGASLCCAQCLERDAQVQCGHQCETAFYCGQECADAHYDVHKLECVGARAGRGRSRGGKGGGRRGGQDKVHKVMEEFKHHQLHSGSKNGPIVTNRKQAIAIALAEAGRSRK